MATGVGVAVEVAVGAASGVGVAVGVGVAAGAAVGAAGTGAAAAGGGASSAVAHALSFLAPPTDADARGTSGSTRSSRETSRPDSPPRRSSCAWSVSRRSVSPTARR